MERSRANQVKYFRRILSRNGLHLKRSGRAIEHGRSTEYDGASQTDEAVSRTRPEVLQRAVDKVDDDLSAGSTGWQWGVDTPPGSPKWLKRLERETGVEPATFSLGS